MWTIIVSLVIGIFIGIAGVIPKKYMKINSRFQQIGLILLLFSMGASIGANKELIKELKNIGVKAITFAVLTCLFSILFTYAVTTKFINKHEEGEKE